MITIKASVNGKTVPLSQFGTTLEQAIYTQAAEGVKAKLEGVRCPEHGSTLDAIVLKKAAGGRLTFDLEGCCQKLAQACEEELANN